MYPSQPASKGTCGARRKMAMLPPRKGAERGRSGAVSASSPASEKSLPFTQHRVASSTVWNTCACDSIEARSKLISD